MLGTVLAIAMVRSTA
ncbi:hypothetical protein FIU00_05565 [Methylophilus medardicus]|uniref:Uncharacterized protein n=1 Tax=Methylophilus medardicus TaxID=2588534 RepID=A0A5B8CVR1_9PROT|nr:hypothetical protein FIU01_05565 [Methylophilus medardicus]QDC50350.1 hypothetical protein FIU00_05565 [Methylophilus medardicus]QDC54055.1 hypothetical protein FIT99_05565 [Methylophilus medardicus]